MEAQSWAVLYCPLPHPFLYLGKHTEKEPSVMAHTCNPGTGELKQEEYEFQASLGYIVSALKVTYKEISTQKKKMT